MGLSFEESMKSLNESGSQSTNATTFSLSSTNTEETVAPVATAFLADDFTKSDKYLWYDEYEDANISSVDNMKNVSVNQYQINLTQESNSQYIPFEMNRYYDGVDLMNMNLFIHYVNAGGYEDLASAINVSYSSNKIRFAWLVSKNATSKNGSLKFEIHAIGVNSKGDEYIWKTRPNSELNVLQSLEGNGVIEPDSSWITSFLTQVNEKVAEAQGYAQEAKDSVENSKSYAEQASNAANTAQSTVETAKTELESVVETSINEKISTALLSYYTKEEIDEIIANIDISDQLTAIETEIADTNTRIDNIDGLANFDVILGEDGKTLTFYNGEDVIKSYTIDTTPSEEWVMNYNTSVATKINDATTPIQTSLDEYKETTNADLASIHSDIDGLPEALATDYYTKTATDELLNDKASNTDVLSINTTVSSMQASIDANSSKVMSLGATVADLQETINNVDTSNRLTYDVDYNDPDNPDVGENTFVFYEIENEGVEGEVKTIKKKFTITGGSGGASSGSTLKIGYITTSPLVVTTNDNAIIKYTFSGTDSSGDIVTEGTATWKVAGRIVATNTAINGENSFDITDYISVGTQKVNLTIVDDGGSLVTKNWTVQKVDVRLESTFDDKTAYPIGAVSFDYTPYGAISKDIHFILDGSEIGTVNTPVSGIPMGYSIPAQEHGSHLLEAYITATINGNSIESNHIKKDIIWFNAENDSPVIGCIYQDFTARQYDTINIEYTVYDPNTETPTVEISIDGDVVSTQTLNSNTSVYQYKSSDVGAHVITIKCRDTIKTLKANITKLDIDVSPVTAGLAFDFNPSGRSNNDADRLWSNGTVSMSVSDNFDWVNGGYQLDENGDQYFCVKSGTTATINYNLFADDPKRNGKEFKVVFKTVNVKNRDTSFISCMDNNIGLDMRVENAKIYSSNNSLYSPYCEGDIIEFEFNINKNTDIPMVLTYEDGVGNRPMIYSTDASFMQTEPQPIVIGSDDCDVYIYRMKAYSTSLTDSGILANFIADARNAEEMIKRYERNQIYDENGALTPEVLAEKCPDLRIIMVDAPWFTNDKGNKVDDTNITMIYKNGDPILDNWTCTGARHSGQGTSSNEYGYAGRNIDLIMDRDTSLFTLGDGSTSKTITLTRDSVPTDYLNVKVNIASSENQNNAQMARRYEAYEPFKRIAKLKDSKVKDTMEFFNCVVFVRERNEDISTHREFLDCEYHYYALGNVGDSKKTDDTRVNDKNDPKECVIEILDYNVPLAEFPTGNGNDICPIGDWKEGNTAYDYLYAPYKYDKGEFESFGMESYEFRYEMKGITEEQRETNINAWREFYKFVVTSTDEEFYANLKKYFVVDSALYYYLFTERYTMVDNRAKNSFWHCGKVWFSQEEATEFANTNGIEIESKYIDNEQASFNEGYRWDLTFGYDFDTCLGIDNTGKLVLTYGKEDIDYYVDGDPTSSYIYRAAESTFFCRLRDLFKSEMKAMFLDRENANAWSSDGLINQWDKYQNEFPEEIWRLDIQRKYLRTYQGISIDNSVAGEANPRFLVEMLNGRKKYQRRMFERNQELYMATKYFGNKATQDQIMMRFNNPVGATISPDFTLYLTPYSDMYIGVKFGNVTPVNFRAKAGVQYTIPYSIATDTADITLIYGASFIQAIGDLSKCYVGDNDFSKASRLQSLTIGSNADGYENTYMTKITLGNNKLLEYLDIRNITGLSSVVDLSQCNNLLELHAEGSGATGVIFSNGGKLKKAYIPSVISLTMKNLNYIEVFDVESYDNLQTLIVENTPFINTYDLVNTANRLNILRLIGINWGKDYLIEDSSILDRLLGLRGIGNDGYETSVSVIAGKFHSAIVKEKSLEIYNSTWKDLDITYETMINQYAVTFKNDDGTILEVQYVDKGSKPTDPVTRSENPISIPTKASTISYDYTYNGWDTTLVAVFSNLTITATYTESLRKYVVKYVSKGTTLQETEAEYGTSVFYEGDIPSYVAEESAYKYYLFTGWDKSGIVNGDKIINAVYDTCEYSQGYFDGKDLSTLRPVEIYAMTQVGVESNYVEELDEFTFTMGSDYDFSDIESNTLIDTKTEFTGSNYIDTGITIFDEDRSFVFAIDYEFGEGNASNSVLAQCFKTDGSDGFKLAYSSYPRVQWGTESTQTAVGTNREMLIIRHIKGETGLHVYTSNLSGTAIKYQELTKSRSTIADSTLVFGCSKADDGAYENYAAGKIYWAKLWLSDLGDTACRSLASYIHEDITMQMCGFKRKYLSSNSSKRAAMSFLAANAIRTQKTMNSSYINTGGWAESDLNKWLNSRFYEGLPISMKQLIKQVKVNSSIGDKSKEITSSDCYIYIPAAVEIIYSLSNSEPYMYEDTAISYMHDATDGVDSDRIRRWYNGEAIAYWTRSPAYSDSTSGSSNYWVSINASGGQYNFTQAPNEYGVVIEFSI